MHLGFACKSYPSSAHLLICEQDKTKGSEIGDDFVECHFSLWLAETKSLVSDLARIKIGKNYAVFCPTKHQNLLHSVKMYQI